MKVKLNIPRIGEAPLCIGSKSANPRRINSLNRVGPQRGIFGISAQAYLNPLEPFRQCHRGLLDSQSLARNSQRRQESA